MGLVGSGSILASRQQGGFSCSKVCLMSAVQDAYEPRVSQ
jgi:hypothetical protein